MIRKVPTDKYLQFNNVCNFEKYLIADTVASYSITWHTHFKVQIPNHIQKKGCKFLWLLLLELRNYSDQRNDKKIFAEISAKSCWKRYNVDGIMSIWHDINLQYTGHTKDAAFYRTRFLCDKVKWKDIQARFVRS